MKSTRRRAPFDARPASWNSSGITRGARSFRSLGSRVFFSLTGLGAFAFATFSNCCASSAGFRKSDYTDYRGRPYEPALWLGYALGGFRCGLLGLVHPFVWSRC